MERVERDSNHEQHVIDISSSCKACPSSSSHDSNVFDTLTLQREDRSSTRAVSTSVFQTSLSSANGSNSTYRNEGLGRRLRSPNSVWILIDLVLHVSQIVAAIVALSLSRHEHPSGFMFWWIVGYASACVAKLPFLYWRWHNCDQASEPDSSQPHQGSTQTGPPTSVSTSSITSTSEGEGLPTGTAARGAHSVRMPNPRVEVLVENFKIALDFFFGVWIVIGYVWLCRGQHSSSEPDPSHLFWFVSVFSILGLIIYGVQFSRYASVCCLLPFIIPSRVFMDPTRNRVATPGSINSLPTYTIKMKKTRNGNGREINSGAGEGGVVASGAEKELVISGEDAVCCICLGKYANNEVLTELPCSHFFHNKCVDKWLKINKMCPLCKAEVGESKADTA